MNKRKIFLFTGESNERFDLAKPSKTSEQTSVNEENLRFIDAWAAVVDHLRASFLSDLLPKLLLQPLVDAKSWQPIAPRCQLCLLGFVRFAQTIHEFKEEFDCDSKAYLERHKAKEDTIEGGFINIELRRLCLPCFLRKLLFDKV
eukprot:gene40305-49372_t